jgi:osmotically inducible lipoprotein OsmB
MMKAILLGCTALALAGCQSERQNAGTATGVVAGALVGGPVGAVVGGAVGATATAPGAPLGGGTCYVTDRRGNVMVDRAGQPLTRRC